MVLHSKGRVWMVHVLPTGCLYGLSASAPYVSTRQGDKFATAGSPFYCVKHSLRRHRINYVYSSSISCGTHTLVFLRYVQMSAVYVQPVKKLFQGGTVVDTRTLPFLSPSSPAGGNSTRYPAAHMYSLWNCSPTLSVFISLAFGTSSHMLSLIHI